MRSKSLLRLPFILAATTMMSAQSPKQVFTVGPSLGLPFSSAVKAGGLVYASGSIAVDASGKTSGDIKAQTKQTLDGLAKTLEAAGSGMPMAASVMVYLRNASDFAAMNEVYKGYWPKDPPARTTVVAPLARPEALVEISMIAIPAGGERRVVKPSDWLPSPNPYSYGILTGNTLFLSGLVSRNGRDNSVAKGDMTAQTRTVLDNGAAILKAAGMSYADVASARVFITDTSKFQDMNAAYRPYFASAPPPARATVNAGLTSPDYLVEITMVAVKDSSRAAITTPNADGTPGTANPNLSSAIRVGNRLFVAGTLGTTDANAGQAGAQTTEALARIGRTLKAAGFDWPHVVDSMVYLPDVARFGEMNDAYRAVLTKDFPARTTIQAGLMGAGGAVEIMMTAVK
jgi:enamine deaminase RidA (YjgF/YER057c/UK114 family)